MPNSYNRSWCVGLVTGLATAIVTNIVPGIMLPHADFAISVGVGVVTTLLSLCAGVLAGLVSAQVEDLITQLQPRRDPIVHLSDQNVPAGLRWLPSPLPVAIRDVFPSPARMVANHKGGLHDRLLVAIRTLPAVDPTYPRGRTLLARDRGASFPVVVMPAESGASGQSLFAVPDLSTDEGYATATVTSEVRPTSQASLLVALVEHSQTLPTSEIGVHEVLALSSHIVGWVAFCAWMKVARARGLRTEGSKTSTYRDVGGASFTISLNTRELHSGMLDAEEEVRRYLSGIQVPFTLEVDGVEPGDDAYGGDACDDDAT